MFCLIPRLAKGWGRVERGQGVEGNGGGDGKKEDTVFWNKQGGKSHWLGVCWWTQVAEQRCWESKGPEGRHAHCRDPASLLQSAPPVCFSEALRGQPRCLADAVVFLLPQPGSESIAANTHTGPSLSQNHAREHGSCDPWTEPPYWDELDR